MVGIEGPEPVTKPTLHDPMLESFMMNDLWDRYASTVRVGAITCFKLTSAEGPRHSATVLRATVETMNYRVRWRDFALIRLSLLVFALGAARVRAAAPRRRSGSPLPA